MCWDLSSCHSLDKYSLRPHAAWSMARRFSGKRNECRPFLNFIPQHKHKRNENLHPHKTCIPMFITASFIVVKRWKQPEYPSMDKWINKRCYSHTVEYYLARKKGVKYQHILQYEGNFETLCWVKEANHRQPHIMISFTWKFRIGNSIETDNGIVAGGGVGRGVMAKGYGGSFLRWWKDSKLTVAMISYFCEYVKNNWIEHF